MAAETHNDGWDGVRSFPHRRSMDGIKVQQRCSLDGVRPNEKEVMAAHTLGFDDGYVPVTSYYAAYNSDSINMTLRHDTASTSFGDLVSLDQEAVKPVKVEAVRIVRRPTAASGAVKPSRSEVEGTSPPNDARAVETPVPLSDLLNQKLVELPAETDERDGWRPTDYYKVIKYYKASDAPRMDRQSSLLDLQDADNA